MLLLKCWNITLLLLSLLLAAGSSAFVLPPPHGGRSSAVLRRAATDPLAQEGDWSAYLDQENTGLVYYFNGKTGESMWEPPTDTFPPVMLNKKQRELAQEQRKAYFGDNKQEQQQQQPARKGFFSGLLDREPKTKEEKEEKTERKTVLNLERKQEDEANWFDGLFDMKQAETAPKETAAEANEVEEKVAEEKQEKRGFFSFGSATEKTVFPEETAETPADSSVNGEKSFVDSIFGISSRKQGPTAAVQEPVIKEEKIFTTPIKTEPEELIVAPVARPIDIDMSAVVLPHPAKVSWGGEDAVFTNSRSFGVFDGVSGAEKLDGIPLYSFTLADEMKRLLGDGGATLTEITKKLSEAADFADRAATGASTAVVASIDEKGFLRVLNLGDSVCLVIRNGSIVAKTREIVHYFDCPYQLSEDSPDRPKDGTKLNLELMVGDVIVMASDGVFDNLSDETVLDLVKASPGAKAAAVAKRITNQARKISLNEDADTPYAKLAKRNGFDDFGTGLGGKVDDVSCVVVRCT